MAEATHLSTSVDRGVLIAHVTSPSISQYEADVIRDQVLKEAPGSDWKVALDFEEVRFLASAGLGMIVELHNKAKAAKGKLFVCNLCGELHQAIKLTKLDRLFNIVDDVPRAVKKLS